jgi:hypothetical protein
MHTTETYTSNAQVANDHDPLQSDRFIVEWAVVLLGTTLVDAKNEDLAYHAVYTDCDTICAVAEQILPEDFTGETPCDLEARIFINRVELQGASQVAE